MAETKKALQKKAAQKLLTKPPVEDPVIRITGIKDDGPDLIMNDGGETATFADNTITWEIHTPEVSEIYLILPDNAPSKVFRTNPNNKRPSKTWKGKTKYRNDLHEPITIEKYTIIYKRKAPDDKLYFYDPIIQVNT